jgi:hypothetical protein
MTTTMRLTDSQLIATALRLAIGAVSFHYAKKARDVQGYDNARYWALKSLEASIGKSHPIYLANIELKNYY